MINFNIPFNKPFMSGNEIEYIADAHAIGFLSGNGKYTELCQKWLEKNLGAKKALLTHSCTAALEMAAILANISPGDEIIMPSFTFVSSANAFVLRGGVPVFVDIDPVSLNIDENLIEQAITSRTKAIVPVHYAGLPCNMDVIMDIASEYNLIVIEDAAQGILSEYKGSQLGSIGHLACISFHETKNVISGEGGALLINDENFLVRSEIIHEKGTDRSQFKRGEVNKYTWQDIGSSFLPSEITAAFLWAQLKAAREITTMRLEIWNKYHLAFNELELDWLVLPSIPKNVSNNGHIYYLKLRGKKLRDLFIHRMNEMKISCIFHYIPLHNSPAGKKYSVSSESLLVTEDVADSIVRLPIWIGLAQKKQDEVIEAAVRVLKEIDSIIKG